MSECFSSLMKGMPSGTSVLASTKQVPSQESLFQSNDSDSSEESRRPQSLVSRFSKKKQVILDWTPELWVSIAYWVEPWEWSKMRGERGEEGKRKPFIHHKPEIIFRMFRISYNFLQSIYNHSTIHFDTSNMYKPKYKSPPFLPF